MSHLQNCSLKIYLKRALGGSSWGGQDGCERKIKDFVKIQKNFFFFFLGGGGGSGRVGGGGGGQGRCEQGSEVFVKIQKKIYIYIFFFWGGGGGGSGRGVFGVDVNEELKFL